MLYFIYKDFSKLIEENTKLHKKLVKEIHIIDMLIQKGKQILKIIRFRFKIHKDMKERGERVQTHKETKEG